MKKVKLGIILLVSVIALAGVTAGYALWSETLYIDTWIETGDFDIDMSYEGKYIDQEKDIAYVDVYFSDDGQTMFIDIYEAYPCITFYIYFDVTCVGSIPAHFYPFDIDYENCKPSWIDIGPRYGYDEIESTQLHQGDSWSGVVEIHLDNDAEEDYLYQFSVKLTGGQYNEIPIS